MAGASIVGGIAAGAQTLFGIGQSIAAGRKRKKAMQAYKENPYMIPESQIRATNIASKMAQGTDLPAQDLIEERLASGTAETVARARDVAISPSQVLQSTVNSYLAEQKKQQELDVEAASSYETRQGAYANALTMLAPYETKKYEFNTLFPIQSQLNAASAQGAAGMSNIGSGISSGLSMYANQQYLDSLNTAPTNGMEAGTMLATKTISSLPSQALRQGLMPMNNRAPYWGGGQPDYSIQQRQGTPH